MMLRNSIRYFSTKVVADKYYKILQASSPIEKEIKLKQFVKNYFQNEEKVSSNLFNDIIQRWIYEQPIKEALWSYDTNKKLTFNDLYEQSSRIANVFTGKEFDLKPGKAVLTLLPKSSVERTLIQLACLQSGLVFCSMESNDLSTKIPTSIQKLAVDCVITNEENLEIARKYTYNPLRPLKKGLITNGSTSEPLPVGWTHFLEHINHADNKYTKKMNIHPETHVIRSLTNENEVMKYSQKDFYLNLIISSVWLNLNRTSRFIWMKNENDIISIVPWLSGSTIFYKNIKNPSTMLKTLEEYPIDTFCASSTEYQMIDNQKYDNKTHLKQLISAEPIDSTTINRWFSLTKLTIRDESSYMDFYNKSIMESVPKEIHDRYQSFMISKIPQSNIPWENLFHQFPKNHDRPRV